jgi:hypothetical protein
MSGFYIDLCLEYPPFIAENFKILTSALLTDVAW